MILSILLISCILLPGHVAAVAARAPGPTFPGDQEPHWRSIRVADAIPAFPVRIVAPEEPWEQVAQDIRLHFSARVPDREVRVGFYGHGAFVTPREVLQAVPFVAALGATAELDVMVLPHWRFPATSPWQRLPRQFLSALLTLPLENVGERMLDQTRRFALEHRAATASAVVRLAEGLSVFQAHHMTPSLAAFSNSALVLVRLGELLEHGQLSDGHTLLSVSEVVRQGVALHNVVTFGYPLPHGQVSRVLRQRIRGVFVNVVPEHCGQQWQGNFLLRGPVENLPVSWAPAHADWPRLALQGPEVAALGTLLRGQGLAPQRQLQTGEPWWGSLCAAMQHVDPAGAFEVLN